jgi:hypothetical protein
MSERYFRRAALPLALAFAGGLTLPARAQVLNSVIAEDPLTAHWKAHASAFNPAWAGASGEPAVFLGGQNLIGVLDSLSGGSSILGIRSPIGDPGGPLAVCADLQYSFVPFVARFVTGNAGFSYRALDEAGHRVWVGGSIGLGSREVVRLIGAGQPDPTGRRNRFYPNLNAGIWYRYRGLHLGAGGTHLGNPTVDYGGGFTNTVRQRFYILAAYDAELDGLRLTPAIQARYANTNAIVTDLLLDAELGGGFGIGGGFRADLGRRPPPNPSNPVSLQRFRQVLASAELRVADVLTLRGTYLYTPGAFVIDRNNLEVTLVYRWRDVKPRPVPGES